MYLFDALPRVLQVLPAGRSKKPRLEPREKESRSSCCRSGARSRQRLSGDAHIADDIKYSESTRSPMRATSGWWVALWNDEDPGAPYSGSSEGRKCVKKTLAEAPSSIIGVDQDCLLTLYSPTRYVLTAAHCLCATKAAARKKEGWCNGTNNVIEIDNK